MIVYIFFLLIALIAVGRIIRLQFFSDYKNQLDAIVYRSIDILAYRGSILSYDGRYRLRFPFMRSGWTVLSRYHAEPTPGGFPNLSRLRQICRPIRK